MIFLNKIYSLRERILPRLGYFFNQAIKLTPPIAAKNSLPLQTIPDSLQCQIGSV